MLDPWEVDSLEEALGERSDGRWSAFEVGLIVPRQNGKGAILEAREIAGLFLFDEELILHSAHEFKTAAEAFRRVLRVIQGCGDLDRRVMKVRTSHGEEGIELRGGQRLRFVARSTGSGRGFSGDTVILDEAYNLSAASLSALLPTMAARPNPQLWYTSSAPLETPESAVLRALCRRGRAGKSESLAFMEFCTARPADDVAGWAEANPGFGIRITEEFIRHEREAMLEPDFARERLGQWVDLEDGAKVIPLELWDACEETGSGADRVCFAFDVSPDRANASIAAAGRRSDGLQHLEVVDVGRGTGWLVPRLVELKERWSPPLIVCDPAGPAGALLVDLESAGVKVTAVSFREHQQACGAFYDGVVESKKRHLGDPLLRAALEGATKRPSGDAWLWSRKSAVDISPLVAVTLAAWADSTAGPCTPQFFSMDDLRALAGEGAADGATPADARPDGDPPADRVPGVLGG